VGYYSLDTTTYENGVHTIAWSVIDDAGNTDGIGSRYFTIQNSLSAPRGRGGLPPCLSFPPGSNLPFPLHKNLPVDYPAGDSPIRVIKDYNPSLQAREVYPDADGNFMIEIHELQRLEIHLVPGGTPLSLCCGYQEVGTQLRPLPIGSTLDAKKGIFYWQPGPGFNGEYRFVFLEKVVNGEWIKKMIQVVIK
jgi:hypothetical protein